MAGLNLNALTENASRLGARIQETISEHTRDLAISRIQGPSYFDAPEERLKNIRKQLDSNSDREKLDGLKTLIALISKNRNVSEYFAYVVKNVASQNLEIRKLVYIFLLRYAESEPDLALLSINTFQRDLADPNPLIRAMALRVLSGINVPMIGNIVVLAIKKSAADSSPYVRKAAAYALMKCYNMDSSHLPSLIPIMEALLKDKSTPHLAALSIGSVAVAFQIICPTRLDLLHKHYRRLCRILVDADSWGQVNLLELLARYARAMLAKPVSAIKNDETVEDIDPDLQLLLTCSEPLFMSQNAAVVLAVTRVFYYLSTPSQLRKTVSPLLRLLHVSKEIERVVLSYIVVICREHPDLFAQYYTRVFVRTTDMVSVKRAKLAILLTLITPDNYQILLREFAVYAEDSDARLASDSVKAIGRCAKIIPESASHCLTALLGFIKNGNDTAISTSVLVLKSLVQSQLSRGEWVETTAAPESQSPLRIVADLAERFDDIKHPSARACVIWLVGQYASSQTAGQGIPGIAMWAPDVLRRGAKTFATEASVVKLQLLTLAAKLLILSSDNSTLLLLTRYIFSMARYDANYDVRDRARMLGALLDGVSPQLHLSRLGRGGDEDESDATERGGVILRREQVKVVLFEGKLLVQEKDAHTDGFEIIGSMHTVLEKPMTLYSSRRLPDWPDEGTDSSLRDAEEEYPTAPIPLQATSRTGFGSGMGSANLAQPTVLVPIGSSPGSFAGQGSAASKGAWKNLDEFLASEDEESGDEESEDGEATGSEHSGQKEAIADEHNGQESHEDDDDDDDSEEEDDEEDKP